MNRDDEVSKHFDLFYKKSYLTLKFSNLVKIKYRKKPNNYLRYFFLIQQQSVAVWRGALARCWAVMAAAGCMRRSRRRKMGQFAPVLAAVLVNSRGFAVLGATRRISATRYISAMRCILAQRVVFSATPCAVY